MLTARRSPRTQRYELVGSSDSFALEANRYLESLSVRGLSSLTVRSYAFAIARFRRWHERQAQPFADLTQTNLVPYVAELRDEGVRAKTINHRLTVVRELYRFVVNAPMKWGRGFCPPSRSHRRGAGYDRKLGLFWMKVRAEHVLVVKEPRKVIEPLTADQVEAFLRTLRRWRDRAIVYMMLLCGLRSREVLGIRIGDIDADDHCLRVLGKGNKERVVPMAAPLEAAVARYLRLERPRRCSTEHLFVVLQGRMRGAPMTPTGLRSLFRQRRLRPRLRNANAHRMRHTFGVDMARAGVSLAALQRLMGHAYPETTMAYINLSMRDITEAYFKAIEKLGQRGEQ